MYSLSFDTARSTRSTALQRISRHFWKATFDAFTVFPAARGFCSPRIQQVTCPHARRVTDCGRRQQGARSSISYFTFSAAVRLLSLLRNGAECYEERIQRLSAFIKKSTVYRLRDSATVSQNPSLWLLCCLLSFFRATTSRKS